MPNFDPFLDKSKVSAEMVLDLSSALKRLRKAQEILVTKPTTDATIEFIEAHAEISGTVDAIRETILTVPVMVHVAGPRKWENNPDDDEQQAVIQRCARCGSVLHWWYDGMLGITANGPQEVAEDEIDWWSEGEIVAKHNGPGPMMAMYLIDKERQLEDHEMECVALNQLSSD